MPKNDHNNRIARFIAPALISPQLSKVIKVLIGTELLFWIAAAISAPLIYTESEIAPFPAESPFGTLIMFAIFAVILVLFHLLTLLVHGRGVETMLGPLGHTWFDFKVTLKTVSILAVCISLLPPFLTTEGVAFTRNITAWTIWVVPAIICIAIQAGTEEVIYRGYLQQQLAVRWSNRWVWMGVPSIIFGAGHYSNGYGTAEGVFLAVWAACLGYACADLTARTGNIGAAIGLHTANNLYASLFYGIENWPGSGLALFLFPYFDPNELDYSLPVLFELPMIVDFLYAIMVLLVMWLTARLTIRR